MGGKARRETWDLSRLVPHARNARTHSAAQIALLAEAIDSFGFRGVVVVNAEGVLLAGHARVLAMARLGRTTVDVEIVDDLSDEQQRAFMLADNKLAELSGWDEGLLKSEAIDLTGNGFDLGAIGFSEKELAAFMPADPAAATDAAGGKPAAGEATAETPSEGRQGKSRGNLADRFGIPPFSVLNAREGWWQDRKRAWLALGIQSELGRGEGAVAADVVELPRGAA